MGLTDREIIALKPQAKKFKVFDGDGLYLLTHPKGGKYWYLKYHVAGRPQEVALGTYPTVSLKLARDRCAHARQQLAQGLNPHLEKKKFRSALSIVFSGVADKWVRMMSTTAMPGSADSSGGSIDPEGEHAADDTQDGGGCKTALGPQRPRNTRWLLDEYLNPSVSELPIASITAQDLLPVLEKIELGESMKPRTARVRWRAGSSVTRTLPGARLRVISHSR